jgi:hypothetical protein
MIPFPALLALLPPSALILTRGTLPAGDAALLGELRETVLGHIRQFKADLTGDPQLAEHIYQIVNSTTEA